MITVDEVEYEEDYDDYDEDEDEDELPVSKDPGPLATVSPFDVSDLGEEILRQARDGASDRDKYWKSVWPNVRHDQIDPCQAAADYYLLFGIWHNAFINVKTVTFPTDEEIRAAGELLKFAETKITERISQVQVEKEKDPAVNLASFNVEAEAKFRELVEDLDLSFREYVHLACGGELRHHNAMGHDRFYNGTRRQAWFKWYHIYQKYGNDALLEMSRLFRQITGGGVGGERWAIASDILYERETETLGPDLFTTKQLFVDRVFTLEHNGGCFLNKLDWVNKRQSRGSKGNTHFASMKNNVLKAHCSNPVNVTVLYDHASEEVQTFLVKYFETVLAEKLEISATWKGKPKEKPKAKTSSIDWTNDSAANYIDTKAESVGVTKFVFDGVEINPIPTPLTNEAITALLNASIYDVSIAWDYNHSLGPQTENKDGSITYRLRVEAPKFGFKNSKLEGTMTSHNVSKLKSFVTGYIYSLQHQSTVVDSELAKQFLASAGVEAQVASPNILSVKLDGVEAPILTTAAHPHGKYLGFMIGDNNFKADFAKNTYTVGYTVDNHNIVVEFIPDKFANDPSVYLIKDVGSTSFASGDLAPVYCAQAIHHLIHLGWDFSKTNQPTPKAKKTKFIKNDLGFELNPYFTAAGIILPTKGHEQWTGSKVKVGYKTQYFNYEYFFISTPGGAQVKVSYPYDPSVQISGTKRIALRNKLSYLVHNAIVAGLIPGVTG